VSKTFWRIAAFGFVLINVGGLIYAAVMGEPRHGFVHVALLAGGLIAWQVVRVREQPQPQTGVPVNEKVLDSLQESIDAIALNVERIGEDQRFQAKLVKEQLGQGSGEADER
jgi:hypothetical protein